MTELKEWQREDMVYAIERMTLKQKKQKNKVVSAAGWKTFGGAHNYIFKKNKQGDILYIIFGGKHPIVTKIENGSRRRFFRTLLKQAGFKEDVKGRFYVGKN